MLNVCRCNLSSSGLKVTFGAFTEVPGFLLLTVGGSKASAAVSNMTRNVPSYNVTSRRVLLTIVAGEKQEAFWVSVCSLSFPAFKAHAPCYIVI